MSLDDKFEQDVQDFMANLVKWTDRKGTVLIAKHGTQSVVDRGISIVKESARRLGYKCNPPDFLKVEQGVSYWIAVSR